MAIKIKTSIKTIAKDFMDMFNSKLSNAHDKSALFMEKQIDLSFENRGFLNENRRGKGFVNYEPTTRIAKQSRKNYPKSSPNNKKGKKGFTQAQAQYLFTANSLEDSGALRSSLAIEKDMVKNGFISHIGTGKPYIKDIEEGSTLTKNGKSYNVPARQFQHATEQEADDMGVIFEQELSK